MTTPPEGLSIPTQINFNAGDRVTARNPVMPTGFPFRILGNVMKGNIMIGKVFGTLTVIKDSGIRTFRKIHWLCLCECGNERFYTTGYLNSGLAKSCGCLKSQ